MKDTSEVTVIGEVLYDCFPDGKQIPGGAPFNVAWNLKALGYSPRFISAVGQDDLGDHLLNLANDWGIGIQGIARMPVKSTGVVEVTLEHGKPSFEIREDVVYDHLSPPKLADDDKAGILYHGSLICRSKKSEETIIGLRQKWKGPVFVDINIRDPWFDLERFSGFLQEVDFLKLNDDEYERLSGNALDHGNAYHCLKALMEQYEIRHLIVTCGASGSYWCDGKDVYYESASKSIQIADTVGAGDAFASVCLKGILEGWSAETTLSNASTFAEKVCTISGATSPDRQFYDSARLGMI